jgi:hypothetical protein
VIFKISCDGVLKYASKPVGFGETADIDLNIAGVDQLTLAAVDAKSAEKSGSASFLSPSSPKARTRESTKAKLGRTSPRP